ncbi:hypothetical protein RJ639_039255, partial [Escallonia herrerae]
TTEFGERASMAGVGGGDQGHRRGGGGGGGRPVPPPGRGPPGPPPHHPLAGKPGPRSQPVDREKTCPLLLRVFTKIGGHHSDGDFAIRGKEPKDEVQIYTWMDATLRELTDLVKEVAPEARRKDAVLSFAIVGKTYSYPNVRRPDGGSKALGDLKFEIGDYLDVAII